MTNTSKIPVIMNLNLVLSLVMISSAIAELTINLAHVNDIHAHFEQVSESTGRCHEEEAENGECYGGMSRMYTLINDLRDTHDNFLLMNAGDYYSGSIWSDQLQYEPIIELGNELNYDVFAFGNHEFDDGLDLVADFASRVNYPIIAANMIETPVEGIVELGELYSPSVILPLESGELVGVIGYLTTDTPDIVGGAMPSLEFIDEIEAITQEAERLKTEEGVDIIVALGHSGYEVDMEIARQIPDVDIVVGGHSHSFLYTGTPPDASVEYVSGDYPTYITQDSGKVVPVVQAYCYTKYMGFLELNFDDNGELKTPVEGTGVSSAEVILLDSSIPQDEGIEEMMDEYRAELAEYYEVVGMTEVFLEAPGEYESNLGDVLTDSMVEWWTNEGKEVEFALLNNGGIRANIEIGEITGEDIYYVLPFSNTVDRVLMGGWDLKTVMESYVADLCPDQSCYPPTFLQMSGLQVVYEIREDNIGNRITTMNRKCKEEDNTEETWCPLELDQTHYFALVSYLAEGYNRDATERVDYSPDFADYIITKEPGEVDSVAFTEFLGVHSPITQVVEDRITIIYGDDGATTESGANTSLNNGSLFGLLSLAFCVLKMHY